MNVEIVVRNHEGDIEPIMRAPLTDGQPVVGDKIHMLVDDGIAVFAVYDRFWIFEQNPNGGGVTVKLLVFATSLGSHKDELESDDQE